MEIEMGFLGNFVLVLSIISCKLKWVFMTILIGFEHHIVQIEMSFHGNSNWF